MSSIAFPPAFATPLAILRVQIIWIGLLPAQTIPRDVQDAAQNLAATGDTSGISCGPLHVAGADALTRLEFARLICAHHGRDPETLRGAPGGPGRPKEIVLDCSRAPPCCACPCAARARSCRREGDRGRRRRDRPHYCGVPARSRHRGRRRRARGAAGHHLRGGGGALVPLPRAPAGAGHPWSAATYDQLARLAGVAGGVRMLAGTSCSPPTRPTRGGATRSPGCRARARGCASRRPSSTCPSTCRGWPAVCARLAARSSAITSPRSTSSTPTPWSTAPAWARASSRPTRR